MTINPNADKHISPTGEAFIRGFESCKLLAYKDYQDKAGNWVYSIGYGHSHVDKDLLINQDQADAFLDQDLKDREKIARNLITVALNQNQWDSVISTLYNVNMIEFREYAAALNTADFDKAMNKLLEFDKSNGKQLRGLTRRRQAEAKMFRGG